MFPLLNLGRSFLVSNQSLRVWVQFPANQFPVNLPTYSHLTGEIRPLPLQCTLMEVDLMVHNVNNRDWFCHVRRQSGSDVFMTSHRSKSPK